MIGKVINSYKIISEIGHGGMGIVYKAFDIKLERYIAIKFLDIKGTNVFEVIQRFKQEAKNQAKLTHPNIVIVYDFIQEDKMLGIAMEYIEGETLEQLIHRKIRLDIHDAIHILTQVLNGIEYAHSKGFVHRDIKPSNIIIGNDGIAKIMDFGISKSIFDDKLNIARKNIGTLQYMSPEQIRGEKSLEASDIYSLGITFYEMLTGQTPFDYHTEDEIVDGQLNQKPISVLGYAPELPVTIDLIFDKLLAKNAADRFLSVKEFRQKLEKFESTLHSDVKGENRLNIFKTKKYKLKAAIYSSIIVLFGLGMMYFIITQVLTQWKSGKNILLLEDKSSKDTIKIAKQNGKLNFVNLKSGVYDDLNSISFINASIGFCCGNNGTVLKTKDSGSTWNKIILPYRFNFTDVCFTKEGFGFMIGDSSIILKSTDNGETWNKVNLSEGSSLIRIKFIDDKNGFILGNKGFLMKTSDGGNQWRSIITKSQNILFDLAFYNKKSGFIVGWNGEVLKTTDLGETWSNQNSIGSNYLKAITFLNAKDGFVIGSSGNLFVTVDSGDEWNKIETTFTDALFDLTFVGKLNCYIVGAKGRVLFSQDGGKNWNSDAVKSYTTLKRIISTSNGNIFAVGVNGSIIKLKLN
ncbi:MAG: YCF48-related protein [Ignavibacteriales bacterium]|nr:YCF48-related protein [Ignavibacteriales bacterium]